MEEKAKLKDKYSLNAYRDIKNSLDTARDEGRVKEKLEIAKKLKTLGIPLAQISVATELPIEEIEKL